MRIACAAPATPECSAMNPAWRPIPSITMTRSWLSAVVCSLSIASIAVLTAVSNPNEVIVPLTSLSIVFGTHPTRSPLRAEPLRDLEGAVAADRDERVDAEVARVLEQLVGAVHFLECSVRLLHRIAEGIPAVRRAEDRAAEVADAAHDVARERNDLVVAEQPGVPLLDAQDVPTAIGGGEHRGADDGVGAG